MDRRDLLKVGAASGVLGFVGPEAAWALHKRARDFSTIPTLLGAGGHGAGGQSFHPSIPFCGNVGLGRSPMVNGGFTTESNVGQVIRAAGKVSYLSWAVGSPFGTTLTLSLNRNSSATSLLVSIGPSITGWVTNADINDEALVSSGDILDFAAGVAADDIFTGSFYCVSARFDANTSSAQLIAAVGHADVAPSATPQFLNFIGIADTPTQTESDKQFKALAAGKWQNMACYVQSNAFNQTTTVASRKNGSNGAMAFSIPAGHTGAFEDVSGSDSVMAGNYLDYQLSSVAGNGMNVRLAWIGAHFCANTATMCMIAGTPSGPSTIPDAPIKPYPSTYYSSLFGAGNIAPTDADRATGLFPYALNAENYTTHVTANDDGAATFSVLKNGSPSGLAVSCSAWQTGYLTAPALSAASFAVGDTCTNMAVVTSDLDTTSLDWDGAGVLLQAN